MAVHRGSDGLESLPNYRDLEVQWVGLESTLDNPSDSTKVRGNYAWDPVQDSGGLAHDEVAELVGYEINADIRETGVTPDTQQGSLYLETIFGLQEVSGTTFGLTGTSSSEIGDFQNTTSSSSSRIEQREVVDNSLLESFWVFNSHQFEDTGTSMAAGGAGNNSYQKNIHYRDFLEHGPLVTIHTEVGMGFNHTCLQSISGQSRGEANAKLYWNIHEAEDLGINVL